MPSGDHWYKLRKEEVLGQSLVVHHKQIALNQNYKINRDKCLQSDKTWTSHWIRLGFHNILICSEGFDDQQYQMLFVILQIIVPIEGGGVAGKEGGGVCFSFFIKNKLKSEICNDKKIYKTKMFFSATTKNLNQEILTQNSVTFKRWDGVKDEKLWYYGWVHWKIQILGEGEVPEKPIYRGN